jgi:hypothetical protein
MVKNSAYGLTRRNLHLLLLLLLCADTTAAHASRQQPVLDGATPAVTS